MKVIKKYFWRYKDKKYSYWYVDAYLKWFYRNYNYTKTYFFKSNIQMNMHKFVKKRKINNILEIGTYEGLASIWFEKKYLKNKSSSLVIVDPFFIDDKTTDMKNDTEKIFYSNFNKLNKNKVSFYKKTSDKFFEETSKKFDFIYIDGSHELNAISNDLNNADKHLVKGGIIWCDDYRKSTINCYIPIDNFLNKNKNRYKVIFAAYQIAFKKIN